MSSILRALKKVETELDSQQQVSAKLIGLGSKNRSKYRTIRQNGQSNKKYIFLFVMLLGLAAIGLVVEKADLWRHLRLRFPAYLDRISNPSKIPPKASAVIRPLEKKTTPTTSVSKVERPRGVVKEPIPENRISVVPKEYSSNPEGGAAAFQPKVKTVSSPKFSPSLGDSEIIRGEIAGLQVHAIAWSSEPKDRIAVVNTRVVREGDSLDGFFVIRIDPEELIIENSSGRGSLVLRNR